ncbi:D-glucuronate isomerase [Chitinophaga costaii]|uniref:Uronate isomerase n=1 Tax=Chitinophaga costaii TaxID=1335309 RepID=A0A1C4FAY5_9BACT|nr:glucuronate isomerase [Chitinophaga costaii]PUZ20726.1 glucuronate isomerase [Chitinophaga costaii]SCC53022.1 D-glucuronate isomerase [Chitinophaga costaii]
MKKFLDEDFLLRGATAQKLYHEYAALMPVIDYHNHLPPDQIATNKQFENISQAWLYGDHYKWRAMRIHGIPEAYCTGGKADWEKFEQWAATVPYTMRNPLYHWTHLELRRYFDIEELLSPATAASIYRICSEKLQTPDYSVQNLLRRMQVKTLCTTDDPADTLEYHAQLQGLDIKVLPAFRPDKSLAVEDPVSYNVYLEQLGAAANIDIRQYSDLLAALKNRHDFFATMGGTVADHGLDKLYVETFTEKEIANIFSKVRAGHPLAAAEVMQFKSALMLQLAEWNAEKGWVQQFHLGALRNTNSRMLKLLGPDTGWDAIGDYPQGIALGRFLDLLENKRALAKTIIYNLNPADNIMFSTIAASFNDGSTPGKVQYGAAWWFLDQQHGITDQLNALSNTGLLSRFIGMLTDSRSFLSYPRHEYFRRILCDMLGTEIDNGELPRDMDWIGKMVQDISYNNAAAYFGF